MSKNKPIFKQFSTHKYSFKLSNEHMHCFFDEVKAKVNNQSHYYERCEENARVVTMSSENIFTIEIISLEAAWESPFLKKYLLFQTDFQEPKKMRFEVLP